MLLRLASILLLALATIQLTYCQGNSNFFVFRPLVVSFRIHRSNFITLSPFFNSSRIWFYYFMTVALSDANQARTKAMEWLLKEWIQPRTGAPARLTGGWRDSNTVRILTSLQLVDNGWIFNPANKEKAELAIRQMNSEILNGLVK